MLSSLQTAAAGPWSRLQTLQGGQGKTASYRFSFHIRDGDTAGWSEQDRIIQVSLSHQGWTDVTLCGTQRDGEEEIKEEDNRMKKDNNKNSYSTSTSR